MSIKLLALDIDGTLLNSQYQIGKASRRAIAEAVARGVVVMLVTGRRFVIAQPIALELELNTPLITHNGALTKNARTLEVIDALSLASAVARRVVVLGKEVGADMVCCYDPVGYGQAVVEEISAENLRLRRYLERPPLVFKQVSNLQDHIREDPIQVMSAGPCARMERLDRVLRENLDGQVKLLKTAYPAQDFTILDILSPLCSKARALAAVAERFGVSREGIMAIGDNHNDLEMLEFAAVSVMMGNATDELKRLGFLLTGTNDEDGVAQAIERFILAYSS